MNIEFGCRPAAAFKAAVLLGAALFSGWAMAADAGRVTEVEGGVSVTRAGKPINVKIGTALQSGDVIVTGVDGRVQWQTADENVGQLSPNSRFAIQSYSYQGGSDGESHYDLQKGGLGTISGQIKSPGYKVGTPQGSISVAGTKYKAMICGGGNCGSLADGLYVAVSEGTVTLTNAAGSASASAGQYLFAAGQNAAPSTGDGEPAAFLALFVNFQFGDNCVGSNRRKGGQQRNGGRADNDLDQTFDSQFDRGSCFGNVIERPQSAS